MNKDCQLLFVDDDPKAGDLLQRFCLSSRFQPHCFKDPQLALDSFRQQGADIIVSDLRMPKMNGIEFLQQIRMLDSLVPVVIITAFSKLDDAVEALRLGASDFLKKPFDMDELLLVIDQALSRSSLQKENQLLKRQLQAIPKHSNLIGKSNALNDVYTMIKQIADVPCNVIITGESGTGKELAARAIHDHGTNPNNPFVVVDCGALTDSLLESELFGHEKGAFTGATEMKPGLFEAAKHGTLFLDEIGNISDAMQMKLLRVIQEKQITRVGGVKPIKVDVRVVVATNADLAERVAQGSFREDLYHRLNVVAIHMPPLRERKDDIPLLINNFIHGFSQEYNRQVTCFDEGCLKHLDNYDWPGNVRELRNLVERQVVLAKDSCIKLIPDLALQRPGADLDADRPSLGELEKRYILKILKESKDNRTEAAKTLGIDKSTLWRKLQSYQK